MNNIPATKYHDKINQLSDQTNSSYLDHGLANSQFMNISKINDMKSIEERPIDESKGTYHFGLGLLSPNEPLSKANQHYFKNKRGNAAKKDHVDNIYSPEKFRQKSAPHSDEKNQKQYGNMNQIELNDS